VETTAKELALALQDACARLRLEVAELEILMERIEALAPQLEGMLEGTR
jgi:hypothetical protein